MSFGFSVGDFVLLVQTAHRMYRNCQKAGPEYVEIARETRSLHSVLKILRTEAKSSEYIVFKQNPASAAELSSVICGCRGVLDDIDGMLAKFEDLDIHNGTTRAGATKKLWQKIRFGSKLDELGVIREKLITCTSTLSVLLDTIQLKSTGLLGSQMKTGFTEMKKNFEAMRKEVLTTIVQERAKHRCGSVLSLSSLSTYDGDNKETWIEFRRDLIAKGFRSQTLDRHKDVLIAYMMMLNKSGVLDKAVQVSSDSYLGQMPWWTKHPFMETMNSLPDLELSESAVPETVLSHLAILGKAVEHSPSLDPEKIGKQPRQRLRLHQLHYLKSLEAESYAEPENEFDPISKTTIIPGSYESNSKLVEGPTTYNIAERSPSGISIRDAVKNARNDCRASMNPQLHKITSASTSTMHDLLGDEIRDESDSRRSGGKKLTQISVTEGYEIFPNGEAAAEHNLELKRATRAYLLRFTATISRCSTSAEVETTFTERDQTLQAAFLEYFNTEAEARGGVIRDEEVEDIKQGIRTATLEVVKEFWGDSNMSISWQNTSKIFSGLQESFINKGSISTLEVQRIAKNALLAGVTEASSFSKVPEGWTGHIDKNFLAAALAASPLPVGPHPVWAFYHAIAAYHASAEADGRGLGFYPDVKASLATLVTAGLSSLGSKKLSDYVGSTVGNGDSSDGQSPPASRGMQRNETKEKQYSPDAYASESDFESNSLHSYDTKSARPSPAAPVSSEKSTARKIADSSSGLPRNSESPGPSIDTYGRCNGKGLPWPRPGILRTPTAKFPEDPSPRREVVAVSHAEERSLPREAICTKISRSLVSTEALDFGGLRYETKDDHVIVLQALSDSCLSSYITITKVIRGRVTRLQRSFEWALITARNSPLHAQRLDLSKISPRIAGSHAVARSLSDKKCLLIRAAPRLLPRWASPSPFERIVVPGFKLLGSGNLMEIKEDVMKDDMLRFLDIRKMSIILSKQDTSN